VAEVGNKAQKKSRKAERDGKNEELQIPLKGYL